MQMVGKNAYFFIFICGNWKWDRRQVVSNFDNFVMDLTHFLGLNNILDMGKRLRR